MRGLPVGLRAYLWAFYVGAPIFVVASIMSALTGGTLERLPLSVYETAAVFVGLVYLGEILMLQVSDAMSQSLATTAQIAAILLLPQPFPLLIAFTAVLLSQLTVRKPLYKRAYNVCHTALTVGASSLFTTLVVGPLVVVRHGAIISTVLAPHNTNLVALLMLVGLYYVHDAGLMTPVLALVDRQSPWATWWHRQLPSLLPELSASTIGILGAMAWMYGPVLVALFAMPVVALRVAFRAIQQAEDRALILRQRGEQLEAVLAVGEQLQLQQTQAELLIPVAEAARSITAASSVAAYLRDPEDVSMLERVVLVPPDATDAGPSHLPSGHWDSRSHPRAANTTLLLPLQRDGASATGLLRIVGASLTVGDDAHDALALLATQATIALQNAQMHERALAHASQDGLTGLLNHRVFQIRLEEEVYRSHRSGRPLALMMFDIDDFGVINNTYGHQAGDTTLVTVAATLRQNLRASDIAARYGGDEFAIILPETTIDEACAIATRIQEAVVTLCIVEGSMTVTINASVGVASLPLHASRRDELIRAADQAAYAAKHAGKGRVCRPEDIALSMDHDPAALAAQLEHANLATVEALAAAVDAKDPYTRGHSQRVSSYGAVLAVAMGHPQGDVARVRLAGLLHDVGKIGVPDSILSKPGKLSDDEFDILKKHSAIGETMLSAVPYLRDILPAVRHHHERWDGHGYPDRLAGQDIPSDAAILMVADSFDAMTSSRVYRPALPVQEAYRRIQEGRGTQFDPRVVDAFERAVANRTFAPLPGSNVTQIHDESTPLAV